MDKEDVVYINNGILHSHKKERNNAICSNMDLQSVILNEVREGEISCDITYMWNLRRNDINELTKQKL